MRHPGITIQNPVRGVWGGPPDGNYQPTLAASKLAFAPRGKLDVASVVKRDLWEIGLKKSGGAAPSPPPGGGKFATPPIKKLQGLGLGALGLVLAGAAILWYRRGRS
jgi:hypothetical protein